MLSTSVVSMNSGEDFGHWLQRQLDRRGWRQAELARRIPISSGAVSHWIRNERIPDPESCDRIADVLGVDVDLVLTLAGHRPATEPIDPDDPVTELVSMIRRVQWNTDRLAGVRSILRGYLEMDRFTTSDER